MFENLKARIMNLPEPERSARRAFYSDEEWEHSWELQAWPHQLPPLGDGWRSWTVIGSRRTGKTEAGYQWAIEEMFRGRTVLCHILPKEQSAAIGQRLYAEVGTGPVTEVSYDTYSRTVRARHAPSGGSMYVVSSEYDLRGRSFDSIWADEVLDASWYRQMFPGAVKFAFTQPVKLDPDTIVSRAGDGRTY